LICDVLFVTAAIFTAVIDMFLGIEMADAGTHRIKIANLCRFCGYSLVITYGRFIVVEFCSIKFSFLLGLTDTHHSTLRITDGKIKGYVKVTYINHLSPFRKNYSS